MRVTKVRVRVDPSLVPLFGQEELLAYVPLDGTAEDLRRHLEDAWPGARRILDEAGFLVDGTELPPGAPVPPRRVVTLRPPG